MRTAKALVFVLVLSWTVSPARAGTDAQHLIRPGVGIGPITLGMPLADVVAILGAPYYERGAILGVLSVAAETEYCWIDVRSDQLVTGGLCVETTKKRIVIAVSVVGDGSYQTAEGLHTSTYKNGDILQGSTEINVRTALGPPIREDNSRDPEFRRLIYKGLTVDVDNSGYVWRVVVK
jgi:hypothetical protein